METASLTVRLRWLVLWSDVGVYKMRFVFCSCNLLSVFNFVWCRNEYGLNNELGLRELRWALTQKIATIPRSWPKHLVYVCHDPEH